MLEEGVYASSVYAAFDEAHAGKHQDQVEETGCYEAGLR